MGDQAKGLSANTISRLKQHRIEEHRNWCQRDLSRSRYVYLPKSVQPKVKAALHEIWMAQTRDEAYKAFDLALALARFGAKDREELLAFYDFPAEHWVHIRTTNPIESTFATVRLRTKRARNCGSREPILTMVYKLLESAQKHWKRIKGFNLLPLEVNNVKFKDGEQVRDQSDRSAA